MNRLQAAEKRYANLKYLWQQAEIEVADLKVQNAELVAALEFYANEDNYTGWTDPDYQWTGESKDYDSSIEGDMGEIARQALAQVKEE